MTDGNYATYLLILKLGTSANREKIVSTIKAYGTWARLTDDVYAVRTSTEKATDIRNRIKPYVGTDGRLLVIRSGYEAAWSNVVATNDWLQKYL